MTLTGHNLVGRAGIEPATPCLKGRRSTTELTTRRKRARLPSCCDHQDSSLRAFPSFEKMRAPFSPRHIFSKLKPA